MSTQTTGAIDTHDMVVVHRLFRRESLLLVVLIAAVAPGDQPRARLLTDHLRDYLQALHAHHSAEDELIWPKLAGRLGGDNTIVSRMEAQHERLARTTVSLTTAAADWEIAAGEDERDRLVAALVDQRAVLIEHLDDEEANLLPLAGRHLTADEWEAQGAHVAAHTPEPKAMVFLGMVLEDADGPERVQILRTVPEPVRARWHAGGREQYERHVRLIRA